MGLFDIFKKSASQPPAKAAKPVDKKIAGPAKTVADKRAQTYDRIEAIEELSKQKSVEAAAALLKRFTFSIDPSITDQEEKEMAFQGIVDAGDGVVEEVVKFCKKAELITWPLKVLRALLDDDGYRKELLGLLSEYDTEYARNVEPKIRVVTALGEVVDEDVRQALVPFLDDANETVRFHAVETTYLAENEECLADMVDLIEREESVRIKNKVAEGVEKRGWKVPEALLERTREALRDAHEFTVADDGSISRRRR